MLHALVTPCSGTCGSVFFWWDERKWKGGEGEERREGEGRGGERKVGERRGGEARREGRGRERANGH